MGILLHFILGYVTSFLGTLFPSMLSMTTVKTSIKGGRKKGIFFAAGVSTIVIGQAYIAVAFSKILLSDPAYLNALQKAGTVVFIALSVFFFYQTSKSKKTKSQKERKIRGYVSGLFFSLLNMFAIPFYVGVTSYLVMNEWYEFLPISNLSFVLGSAFGTFSLLSIYAFLAKRVEKRMIWFANQMDFILGIVTALVAIFNTLDLLL